ncbi:MAG: hypothetical protein R3C16_10485 [Hyphomonadaceae bacterium]
MLRLSLVRFWRGASWLDRGTAIVFVAAMIWTAAIAVNTAHDAYKFYPALAGGAAAFLCGAAAVTVADSLVRAEPIFRAAAMSPAVFRRLVFTDAMAMALLAAVALIAARIATPWTLANTLGAIATIVAWSTAVALARLAAHRAPGLMDDAETRPPARARYAAWLARISSSAPWRTTTWALRANPFDFGNAFVLAILAALVIAALGMARSGAFAAAALMALMLGVHLMSYKQTALRNALAAASTRSIASLAFRDWRALAWPYAALAPLGLAAGFIQGQLWHALVPLGAALFAAWLLWLWITMLLSMRATSASMILSVLAIIVLALGLRAAPLALLLMAFTTSNAVLRVRALAKKDLIAWLPTA